MSINELSRLQTWQNVAEFAELADSLDQKAGTRLFTGKWGQQLQEAISLTAYSRTLNLKKCRLCKNDPPDGEAKDTLGIIRRIEITMVITPHRPLVAQFLPKSNSKHKPMKNLSEDNDINATKENWKQRTVSGIEKKLTKYEDQNFSDLIVYRNISWLTGIITNETRNANLNSLNSLLKLLHPAQELRIWLHTSKWLDQIWPTICMYDIPERL